MICKTTEDLEDALVADLGIERLFSVENTFQTRDGTVAQPTTVPHGMGCISVYHRCRAYEHPHGFEIDDCTIQSMRDHIRDVQANAAEFGGWSSSNIIIQLYRI